MNDFAKCRYWRCGWHGPRSEVLTAPSPFDPDDQLSVCPKCREADPAAGCDEPGCDAEGSCGTPTPDGYRVTCSKHWPGRAA